MGENSVFSDLLGMDRRPDAHFPGICQEKLQTDVVIKCIKVFLSVSYMTIIIHLKKNGNVYDNMFPRYGWQTIITCCKEFKHRPTKDITNILQVAIDEVLTIQNKCRYYRQPGYFGQTVMVVYLYGSYSGKP